MTIRAIAVLAVVMLAGNGCDNESGGTRSISKTEFIDASITEFHNLGWVGLKSQPLTETVSFPDPNNADLSVSPGGLVIREVTNDSPAAAAGLKAGDVIVGIDDAWLPIKDDPTLDFIQKLEGAVAAAEKTSLLRVLRDGQCQSISLSNISKSLDEGLPFSVERFSDAATKGLRYLASLQNADGSFGDSTTRFERQVQTTAIAGLSFLAAGDEQFKANIDLCQAFVATQLDRLIETSQDRQPDANDASKPKPGVIALNVKSIEIDPMTAAYALQFLAECDIPMMDPAWMPRVFGVLGSLSKSQDSSGGWSVSSSDEENPIDIQGAHTTNQVLLGLGMFERTGVMMGQAEMLPKACGFLTRQIAARAAGKMDRRTKASLTAGTAAALVAINCQGSDPLFQQTVADGLERIAERHTAPSLTLPGILSTAILARQTGTGNWTKFHGAAKYWLASVQLPDGSFKSIPGPGEQPSELENPSSELAWEAGHYCLLLSMQKAELQKLTGKATPATMVARNSSGENSAGSSAENASGTGMTIQMQPGSGGPPPGAKVMKLEDLDDETREKLLEQLKSQGVDLDNLKDGKAGKKKK